MTSQIIELSSHYSIQYKSGLLIMEED